MRKPAAALSMGCACLAAFIFLLTGETHLGRLARLDMAVNEMLGRQLAAIILLSKGLHYLFSAISMIVATTALACIFWRKIGRSRAILMTGLILLVAGVNQLIKFAVARPRPVNAMIALSDTAFPSGHTSATTVFVGILCMILLPRLAPGRQRGIMISRVHFHRGPRRILETFPSRALAHGCAGGAGSGGNRGMRRRAGPGIHFDGLLVTKYPDAARPRGGQRAGGRIASHHAQPGRTARRNAQQGAVSYGTRSILFLF